MCPEKDLTSSLYLGHTAPPFYATDEEKKIENISCPF